MSEFFSKILVDLQLDFISNTKSETEKFEEKLKQIGAIVCLQGSSSKSLMIRFDVLISALKVHGYIYGDMTILADQLSRSLSEIGNQSRDILKALANKAIKALKVYMKKLSAE